MKVNHALPFENDERIGLDLLIAKIVLRTHLFWQPSYGCRILKILFWR